MQYKMYKNRRAQKIIWGLMFSFLIFQACSSVTPKTEELNAEAQDQALDGREPASMQGDYAWLHEVEEDFDRIASETSSRSVASDEKDQQELIKQKSWSFSFYPPANHFMARVAGRNYKMLQTSLASGGIFSFTAEGMGENPITLSVLQKKKREVASGNFCTAELTYWSDASHSYRKETAEVTGKACVELMQVLKDYVP